MHLRTLATEPFERVHAAFEAAFADYAVPVRSSLEDLRRMSERRGVDASVSVGAYDGDRLVAVMAVAVGAWSGETTAYDVFTGVAPEHRGSGLAGRMLDHARPLLVERGARRFLLEVLRDNEAAVKAYRRAGFVTRRELECLRVLRESLPTSKAGALDVQELSAPDWDLLCTFHDWQPAWQNSVDSVRRAQAHCVVLAAHAGQEIAGYAVLFPEDGDLAQLAVAPAHRRRSVGTCLLAAVRERLASDSVLRIVNVPADASGDLAFYSAARTERFAGQFEMVMDLV